MKISFTLNEEHTEADVPPEMRLNRMLREILTCPSLRFGCEEGQCGVCSIVLDHNLVYSCLIPAFAIQGKSVLTLEGLATMKEFKALESGFAEASCRLCPTCKGSRYLAAHLLLERTTRPSPEEIHQELSGIRCLCVDWDSLCEAVQNASRRRERKIRVRKI